MNYVLVLVLPSLVLLSQEISGGDEIRNGSSCPTGEFVRSDQENTLTFFTDNSRTYDTIWFKPTSNRLPVKVKAFKDAHIKLETSNSSVAYEIVLGATGNKKTDIRLQLPLTYPTLKVTPTVNLLRGNEFVPFVVSWNSSRIALSKGSNDSDVVIEWSDPTADIDVLRIGLAGYQLSSPVTDGNSLETYQFNEAEVSALSVRTPAKFAYKRFQRTLYGYDGLRFNLSTTGDATIAFLASDDKDFNQPTYKLVIATQGNTKTLLFYHSLQLLATNYTPGTVSSEFWVAWKDGRFALGLGSEFYENSKLISPDSTVVEQFHSMAVDSTGQATWTFDAPDNSCVTTCQAEWYPDWKTRACRKCSIQLSNCFSCTQDQSSERPICTLCKNGTVMLDESGECLLECPPHIGYTPDNGKRKCVCSYGSCCGPVAFRVCFQVIPCLLGVLFLLPILLFAIRRIRRLYIIDPQRIDSEQLSKILKLIPPHVRMTTLTHANNLYFDDVNLPTIDETPAEPSFYHEIHAPGRRIQC